MLLPLDRSGRRPWKTHLKSVGLSAASWLASAPVFSSVLLFAPLPLAATAAAAAFLGPAIGVGSLGLRQLIRLHGRSVTASSRCHHEFRGGRPLHGHGADPTRCPPRRAIRAAARLVGVWLGSMSRGMFTSVLARSFLPGPCGRWRPLRLPGFVVGFLVIGELNHRSAEFVRRRTVSWSLVSGRDGAGRAQIGWARARLATAA